LLEEIGKPYETVAVDLRGGEQYKPAYSAVNPKQVVPTLQRDDGSILTEYPAIAWWLAAGNPDSGLLPTGIDEQARVLERLDYIVSTLHMHGFRRLFRPSNFTPSAADEEKVRARGREILAKGFLLMDEALAGRDYLAHQFSIADSALFYVSFWASGPMNITLPPHCAAHYQRMLTRPAVQRVVNAEGLTP
jgi:glutathione S-transferase